MTVYQIVLQAVADPEIFQCTGEVFEMGVHRQLIYGLDLARRQVDYPGVVTQVYNLSFSGVMGAGIDIYDVSAFAQLAGQLPDIDAHAAGVLTAQLAHRTAMDTEHSYFQSLCGHQFSQVVF
jgi:hypothetical protein